MDKNVSLLTEDCAADHSINAVYLLQDVLHETVPLLGRHECGLDLSFNAVQVAVRFDRDA